MFERLPPQISIGSLVGATQSNYSVAASYYAQKRAMFKNFLHANYIESTNFDTELTELITTGWNKEIMNVLRGIYFNRGLDTAAKEQLVRDKFDTSPYVDYFIEAMKQKNPQVFFSKLGFVFEEWLQTHGLQKVIEKGSKFGSAHADQLVSTIHTGAMKSVASAVKGNQYIRPDMMIALSGVTFEAGDDQVLRESSTGIPVEMQGEIIVDYDYIVPSFDDIIENSNYLQRFLDGNFYGFSAKLWSKSDNKGFMSSSVLRDKLNSVFNQTDSAGRRHYWQIDYTSEYVAYELSKNILHIVGPTDIAMLTGAGVTWMDDFLSAHIFYMRVQVENYIQAKEEGRILPQITDSEIYLRNYAMGSTITAMKSNLHKTKRYGNYIDLRIEM